MTRARHAIVLVAVAATAAAACGCYDSSSSGAASAPKRQQLPAPTVSEADSPFRVRLSWTMPAGAKADGFELARDGDAIATLPSTATHYVDRDVSPKSYHVYSVVATRGSHHSQAGMVDAKLAMPKLADARLEGYFNVRLKLVSSSGYKDDIPSTRTVGWHFKPLCRHGACDVIWRDTSSKTSTHTRNDTAPAIA
jgi:hypothetical protein